MESWEEEIRKQNLQKAIGVMIGFDLPMESIEKGGEGSKGGKIIGHTKSGKPIYEGSEHHRVLQAYRNNSNHKAHAVAIRKNIARLKKLDEGKPSAEQTSIYRRELEKKAKIHDDLAGMKD
jgi:hypothetical protein